MTNNRKIHKFENPLRVFSLLLGGKSITRSLFNLAIERYEMTGKVLDLGSKNGTPSYYQHIKRAGECQITFTDLVPGVDVVQVDVEKPFPFEDSSFDTVISFHLVEHVYDFWKMPTEVFRVLKPGGRLIISVPFMHEYHADPGDYWRMSGDAVSRLFESAGFSVKSIETVGEGIATFAATKLVGMVLPRSIRPYGMALSYLLFTWVDRLVNYLRKNRGEVPPAEKFAIDILCVFEKHRSLE